MAIAFVAAATGNAGGTASVTIGAPAGIAAGDLLVAGISTRGGSVVTPAGWTHVRTVASLSGHYSVTYVYVKLATVADVGASWQWALSSGTTWWAGTIAAYSGAARATLWVESAEYANNAQNLAITGTPGASGISGTRTIVVYSAAYSTAGTTPTITPASGTTRGAPSNDTVRNTLVDDTAAPSSARSAAVNLNSVTSSVTLVLAPRYSETPTAPTLTAPANGGFVSAGLTINLEGTFNDPDSGDVPSAYAARIKESGGAYQWVDAAGQMAAVETWVPHVSTALLAAIDALELAADTTYNWSLAAKDSLGNVSPYASDRTFTTQAPPDVLATGPATTQGTTRPTGTWSYASGGQTEWEAAFFTAAQVSAGGFDPDVAVPVTGSGVVAGSTEREWEAADDLGAGDYWFYIHVAENGVWSDWDAIAFAIELKVDPPEAMTVTPDPDTASVAVAVLTPHRVLADQLTARVAEVQRRIDGGVWEAVRDGEAAEFAAGVLADLNAVWLAEAYDPDVGQFLMDQSGNGHHLRLGSQWPAYVAKGALNLPGIVGNYASTPDSVANSVTGDIDIVVHAALTDWTPSALPVLVAKRSAAGGSTTAFAFYLNPTSTLGLAFTAGATPVTATSTASLSVADGADKWLRVTRDATSGEVIFYSSDDGETWTPLGTAVASTAGLIPDTTADLQVGAQYTGGTDAPTNGRIFYAEVRDGIGGDPVAIFDPSDQADFATSWTASTGEVWTVASTAGTDTNDPLFLDYTGTKYVYLPGVGGNYLSVPDEAALDITGDIDVRSHGVVDTWGDGAPKTLISKDNMSGSDREWYFSINDESRLLFIWWEADGTQRVTFSPLLTSSGFPSGTPLSFRVTLDADNGSGGHDVKFFTSPDDETWTQLGATTNAGAFTTNIRVGASAVRVGAAAIGGTGAPLTGKVHRAQVFDGIDGTKVLDIDTSVATPEDTTFLAETGQTVTINRSTSGRKTVVVDRDLFLMGTDDLLTCPDPLDGSLDFAAGESGTVIALFRKFGTLGNDAGIISKATYTAAPRWVLYNAVGGTPTFGIRDAVGAVTAARTYPADGVVVVLAGVRNVTADNLTAYTNGTGGTPTTDTTGTLANAEPIRIGQWGLYADMEFIGAAIVKRVLTADEMDALLYEVSGLYAPGEPYREAIIIDREAPFHRDLDYRARIVETRA